MKLVRKLSMTTLVALMVIGVSACGYQGTSSSQELTPEQRAYVNAALPSVGQPVPGVMAGHPLTAIESMTTSSQGMLPVNEQVLIQSEVSQLGSTYPYNTASTPSHSAAAGSQGSPSVE